MYYYAYFSRLIEAGIQLHPPPRTSIYSASYRIRRGQTLSRRSLLKQLFQSGYSPVRSQNGRNWYRDNGESVEVYQNAPEGRIEALDIFISKSGYVQNLVLEGKSVQEISLQPQFLSTLTGRAYSRQQPLEFSQLPSVLVSAVLAAEDADFFTHPGIDLVSLVRALLVNLIRMEPVQGGSTLTQQFAKNYFLSPEKSLKRKLEEMFLAILLERQVSKIQIFELYANRVYLGQLSAFEIRGFGQASRVYFGKDVKNLSLGESALLAGMIQAPNRYSPYHHRAQALQRRDHILSLMAKNHQVTPRQAFQAQHESLYLATLEQHNYLEAPHFVDLVEEYVRNQLREPSLDHRNLKIYTTLDPHLQKIAYEAVRCGMKEIDQRLSRHKLSDRPEAALVALDPITGEILALVGGRNYFRSQFNRATRAYRQPGSTFKPFVYATALGRTPPGKPPPTLSSQILDEPYSLLFGSKRYSPKNFGSNYYGNVSLREALSLSLNVPTVKIADQIGFSNIVNLAEKLEWGNKLRAYPSLALGTFEVTLLELTRAYTIFVQNGQLASLRFLSHLDSNGVIKPISSLSPKVVITPQVAFLVTSALESSLESGTAQMVRQRGFLLPAAGKTGTSQDAWFLGYTPDLLCGVWVGYDESKSLNLTGSEAALPIWTEFMNGARSLGRLSGSSFSIPPRIESARIDSGTGRLALKSCDSAKIEYYRKGTEPRNYCTIHN